MGFWMLRKPTGWRLSNPKHRKSAKIHTFGRIRIIPVTLTFHSDYHLPPPLGARGDFFYPKTKKVINFS